MRKLAISLAITSVLGLTACDDTTLVDVQTETSELREEAKVASVGASVVFDPGAGNVALPNDLLFSGTTDFTLETPAEAGAKAIGEAVDFTNPEAAIGALDGWGTQNAFTVSINYDNGITLDAATVASGNAVALYEMKMFPNLTDADCADASMAGMACKGVDKLTFGIDYVAQVVGGDIAIIPMKPFKAGTSYMLALTQEIKDSQGNPLQPSSTYGSVQLDITTHPLVDPNLTSSELNATQAGFRTLQTMFNSFENVLERDFDANKESIIYTQAFTTVSAGVAATDPLQITKKLNASAFAAAAATDPLSVGVGMVSQGFNAAQAIFGPAAVAAADLSDPANLPILLYSTADVYGAQIQLPYYLDNASGNPLTTRWEAACDSGVALMSLTAEQMAGLEATVPDEKAANHAMCKALGLADYGIDQQRHLTKFNPIPAVKSVETVEAMITMPNVAMANVLRAAQGLTPISKPEGGWPIVILQHGITGEKENMIANTGFLSMFGFATISIDHPLHGKRGFDLDNGDGTTTTLSATTQDPTHYLNLQSLLTARDNVRQSVADALKLRLSINALVDATLAVDENLNIVDPTKIDMNAINANKVYYMGHSLGAITGHNVVAIANTLVTKEEILATMSAEEKAAESAPLVAQGTADALNGLYKIEAAVLANPGSSIANFLLESASFGPLVKASVAFGLGGEVTQAAQAQLGTCGFMPTSPTDTPSNEQLVCAYMTMMENADSQLAGTVSAGLAQFAFAAQAVIEAGDPSNYTTLMKNTDSAVLVYEMVGDIEKGGENLPDQVVPNSISSDPFMGIAGTSGLANQLGLPALTESLIDSSDKVSGVIKFTVGSHSTMAVPDTELTGNYPALYSLVNQELQMIMSYFFLTDGRSIKISDDLTDNCTIKGANEAVCNP